jgi:hypothetical protein
MQMVGPEPAAAARQQRQGETRIVSGTNIASHHITSHHITGDAQLRTGVCLLQQLAPAQHLRLMHWHLEPMTKQTE